MNTIDWAWVKRDVSEKERIPGAKKGFAADEISSSLDECITIAGKMAKPDVLHVVKNIEKIAESSIALEGRITLNGRRLAGAINKADKICLFLATIGGDIEKEASRLMAGGDSLKGYLLDRIGSAMVESLADSFEKSLRAKLAKDKKTVSMRFSPGYCDWKVEEQVTLDKILDFNKLGVRLTESYMMIPRKSVSGLIAIGPEAAFKEIKSPCAICDNDFCGYKRL